MSDKQSRKQPQQLLNVPRDPPPFPPPSCPRCSSCNTKFCYYNNYSVSQPRYFCKDCRRYWTHGGAIRSIPNSGTNRKRGRANSASSSSQLSKPTPTAMLVPQPLTKAWSMGSPDNPAAGSSVGGGTFRLPNNETPHSFTSGGFFNRTTFMFGPGGDLGAINNAFGEINPLFNGGAPPISILNHLSPVGYQSTKRSNLSGPGDFVVPVLQRPQHQLLSPPPPTLWTGPNMAFNSTNTRPRNSLTIAREPTSTENVISINKWPEFDDMDIEGDPFQSYKPPSP